MGKGKACKGRGKVCKRYDANNEKRTELEPKRPNALHGYALVCGQNKVTVVTEHRWGRTAEDEEVQVLGHCLHDVNH